MHGYWHLEANKERNSVSDSDFYWSAGERANAQKLTYTTVTICNKTSLTRAQQLLRWATVPEQSGTKSGWG